LVHLKVCAFSWVNGAQALEKPLPSAQEVAEIKSIQAIQEKMGRVGRTLTHSQALFYLKKGISVKRFFGSLFILFIKKSFVSHVKLISCCASGEAGA
jgi:hypothetical protein